MATRHRVALLGFSEFERSTLGLCFRLAPTRVPAYDEVSDPNNADFLLADAEGPGIVDRLTQADRLGDTVFIGPHSVPGALAHARRPIDPILVVRELDALCALRGARPQAKASAASRPEMSDEMAVEPAPPPKLTPPGDPGEPTRPYVRVAELDEAPPPALEVTEMFELPEVFLPEAPEPAAGAADPQDDAPAEPAAAVQAPTEVDVPLESIGPPAEPATEATLPAAPQPPAASPAPQWPDAKAQAKARARAAAARRRNATQLVIGGDTVLEALVLDDNDIAAQYLGQMLETMGFRVHLATTGAEALDALTHQAITLACLDLTLGEEDEFDGLEICQRVKHEPMALGGSPPLVVLVSGQARATDRVRATLAGSDGFLTKPFGKEDLVRVLESCGMTLLPTLTLQAGDQPPAKPRRTSTPRRARQQRSRQDQRTTNHERRRERPAAQRECRCRGEHHFGEQDHRSRAGGQARGTVLQREIAQQEQAAHQRDAEPP